VTDDKPTTDAGPPVCEPTGPEVEDGADNDCDGLIDEIEACGDGSAAYATLADAVAAAPDGGGIEVCPGTYAERLFLERPVHLRGLGGADATVIDAGGLGPAIVVDGL